MAGPGPAAGDHRRETIVTTFSMEGPPTHVVDEESGPLPGHYEAVFTTEGGKRMRRYLTDKGRAAVLRRLDDGQHEFSEDELRDFTEEPDVEALVARMEHESGEGA